MKTGDGISPVFVVKRKDMKMAINGLQKIWVRILLTVLTVTMMVLIFCFSTEPAERSDQTSGRFTRQVIHRVYPDYESYPQERKHSIYDRIQHIVRKAAHFTEFAILGILLRLCLESWFGPWKWLPFIAWAAGTFYAGTDELHQLMTDGRSGQWTDVLLDSSGVLTGVALTTLILWLVVRRIKRKEQEKACQ